MRVQRGMRVYVDPSGSVIADGVRHLGRTGLPEVNYD